MDPGKLLALIEAGDWTGAEALLAHWHDNEFDLDQIRQIFIKTSQNEIQRRLFTGPCLHLVKVDLSKRLFDGGIIELVSEEFGGSVIGLRFKSPKRAHGLGRLCRMRRLR